MARTGVPRYAISSMDPADLAEKLGSIFDLVLVDAPCSGQALVGRGRQKNSSFSSRQIVHSAARQNRILDAAVRLARPGGQLVYSTCTFAEQENESQVLRLIADGRVHPDSIPDLAPYQSTTEGCYRLWPHLHHCAGSFAASMTCCDEPTIGSLIQSPTKRAAEKRAAEKLLRNTPPRSAEMESWYRTDDRFSNLRLLANDASVWGWPSDAPKWTELIAVSGPEIAFCTGETWKPGHAAALRRSGSSIAKDRHPVDAETACRFLSGMPVACDQPGWQVVTFDDKPLGWVKSSVRTGKSLQYLGKNQLPPAARMNVSPKI